MHKEGFQIPACKAACAISRLKHVPWIIIDCAGLVTVVSSFKIRSRKRMNALDQTGCASPLLEHFKQRQCNLIFLYLRKREDWHIDICGKKFHKMSSGLYYQRFRWQCSAQTKSFGQIMCSHRSVSRVGEYPIGCWSTLLVDIESVTAENTENMSIPVWTISAYTEKQHKGTDILFQLIHL